MSVKFGHASKDENSKIKGGNAGDQTGREVYITDYYVHSKGWILLRLKDYATRQKIAEAMEKACANDQIGYDQGQRSTLYNNVKNSGFDPSKTTKNVETDCSELVHVCICYALGEDKTGSFNTETLPDALVKIGLFEKYTDDKYCKSSDYLMRGDILCTSTKGHVVVVLSNGDKVVTSMTASEGSKLFENALYGEYKTTASLNIRNGAGTTINEYGNDKSIMVKAPKGTKLMCCGSYTMVDNRKWLYVNLAIDGVTYVGFASSKYLEKV